MPHQSPCAILPELIAVPPITSAKQESTFNYYGPVQCSLVSQASKFLANTTDAAEPGMASTIDSFIRATRDDCIGEAKEKIACWLTIRVTKPTKAFEVPRWHQDGQMYPYDEGRKEVVRSKYALTLLGPTTLMLEPTAHVFRTYKRVQTQHNRWYETNGLEPEDEDEDQEDMLRHSLADEFKEVAQVRLGDGQVVRFSWGRDDSPVHSEPDLTSDRVFVTILYGSEPELRAMCDWRSSEYEKFDW
jgi:hypothetical protein